MGRPGGGLLRAKDGTVPLISVKVNTTRAEGEASLGKGWSALRNALLGQQDWRGGLKHPAVAVVTGAGEQPATLLALVAEVEKQGRKGETEQQKRSRREAAVEAARAVAESLLPELRSLAS